MWRTPVWGTPVCFMMLCYDKLKPWGSCVKQGQQQNKQQYTLMMISIFFLFLLFFSDFIYFSSIARARVLCESFSTLRVQPDV